MAKIAHHLRAPVRHVCRHEAAHAVTAIVLALVVDHVAWRYDGPAVSGYVRPRHPSWYNAWYHALPAAHASAAWPALGPAQRQFAFADMIVALSAPILERVMNLE